MSEEEINLKEVEMPQKCPNCGSKNICYCPGGTCLQPIPGINWICKDCLNEF